MMFPTLTGKAAASTHFNTAKGAAMCPARQTRGCIYKMQVSVSDSNAFKEDIN